MKPLKWFNYRIVAVLFFTLLFASISSVGAIPLQGNAMQVSCPSEIGDGASSATVKQAMCDAFIRNGGFDGVGAINPDIANGKVHNWGITTVEDPNDYQIQDFEGGGLDDPDGATLIYNPSLGKAFFVRGQILWPYLDMGASSGVKSWLKGPIHDVSGVPNYYFDFEEGQIGLFERGFIANHETMGWSAHTYYPTICDVEVSVTNNGGTATLTANTTAIRAYGYPEANGSTDPFEVYFVIVFPDNRREWHAMAEENLTTFSVEWNDLTLNENVHFYLDAWNRRHEDKYSTYPAELVLNPSHIDDGSHRWEGPKDDLNPLTLADGTSLSMPNDNFLCGGNISVPPPPRPDLTVVEVSPVQAVYNSNFDGDANIELVLNKPLAVRVKVGITNEHLLDNSRQITIEASLQGKTGTKTFSASQLKGGQYVYLVLNDTPNKIENGVSLSVIVDSTNSVWEKNESNNQHDDTHVDVVQAYGMNNAIVRVGVITSTLTIPAPSFASVEAKMVGEWNPYLEAIYPVSPDNIDYDIVPNALMINYPGITNQQNVCPAISTSSTVDQCKVFATIYFEGQKFLSGYGRVIGVATGAGYYEIRRKNTLGFTLSGGLNDYYPSAMLNIGAAQDSSMAHEIGHTLGFDGDDYTKIPANGYWVEREEIRKDNFDFMRYERPRWITTDTYKALFNNTFSETVTPLNHIATLSTSGVMLAGSILADNTVSLFGPYYTDWSAFTATGESLTFHTSDMDGNGVNTTSFGTFSTITGDGDEPIVLDVSVFTFSAPFPDNAINAEIIGENGTIYQFNLHTSLLRQAIASLPDAAFVRHPQQTRNTLFNQVNVLETQYDQANINGIINHLEAIRRYADRWLVPSYQASMEIEYSHDKVLMLIDELLRRLYQIQMNGTS